MWLARYQYTAKHVPGKLLIIADILSRAPVSHPSEDESALELQQEVQAFVDSVASNLPATEHHLKQYQQAQHDNPICLQVMKHCESFWPDKRPINKDLIPYWRVRASLLICNNLLLYNDRIVVPTVLQEVKLQ